MCLFLILEHKLHPEGKVHVFGHCCILRTIHGRVSRPSVKKGGCSYPARYRNIEGKRYKKPPVEGLAITSQQASAPKCSLEPNSYRNVRLLENFFFLNEHIICFGAKMPPNPFWLFIIFANILKYWSKICLLIGYLRHLNHICKKVTASIVLNEANTKKTQAGSTLI